MNRRVVMMAATLWTVALPMAAEATDMNIGPEAPARAYIEAWNSHDMPAMAATLAGDADWINVVGMYWRGRDQIMFAHTAFHKGMFKTVQLDLKSVETRTLGPDAAIVLLQFVQDAYQIPAGPLQPKALDRLSLVVVRLPEGWRIIHGHNTVVDERAIANDPVLHMPK